ncbi:MAG TPA: DUF6516 family protein [Negativicutes bacterium]|jgi:hypothetical protein
MGTAREIIRYKKLNGGRIIEVVIWHLSEPLPGCTHPYKYRLFYGQTGGSCIVRYNNERGKGDHRHVADSEEHYIFYTLRKLVEDFEADIERM